MTIDIFKHDEHQWWHEATDEYKKDNEEYYLCSAEAEPVELNEVDKIIILNTPYNSNKIIVGDIGNLSNTDTWVMITHVY